MSRVQGFMAFKVKQYSEELAKKYGVPEERSLQDTLYAGLLEPEGLLYHMIPQGETGLLPMIAMIFQGGIRMIFTGECVHPDVYEHYYITMKT